MIKIDILCFMNSTLTVMFFVIGNLIGSGFFMMPALLAPIGSNLIYSWSFAFAIALVFSLIFGRLCVLYPKSSVLSDYFKNDIFQKTIAIVYWVACIIGNVGLLVVVISSLNLSINIVFLGFVIISILTIANHFFNYNTIARIEILLTVLKFSILLIFPLVFLFLKPDMFVIPEFKGDALQVSKLGISCFWAFLGIETAAIFGSGKSARNGLLLGIFVCSVLYIFSTLFVVGSVDAVELALSASPFSLVVNNFFQSNVYQSYIGFLIAFTSFGALYGWIAATGKMSLAYSKSNVFGKMFLKESTSKNSVVGLWMSSFITFILFALISNIDLKSQFLLIADLCVYITFLIYLFCSFALLKISKNFLDYVFSILGILSVFLIFFFDLKMTLISLLIMVFVFVFLYATKKKV